MNKPTNIHISKMSLMFNAHMQLTKISRFICIAESLSPDRFDVFMLSKIAQSLCFALFYATLKLHLSTFETKVFKHNETKVETINSQN